ncbi:MAG: hypothetical protein PUG09_11870 [Prevotella sp.]|nr:hypothetical protein [Prevotella sp.]
MTNNNHTYISTDEMQRIRKLFENDPDIRKMRCEQRIAQTNHDYVRAMNIGKKIEAIFTNVLLELIQEAELDVEKVQLNFKEFPLQQREEMTKIIVTLFMAYDIIESAVMDFNDILQRKDKYLQLDLLVDRPPRQNHYGYSQRNLNQMKTSKVEPGSGFATGRPQTGHKLNKCPYKQRGNGETVYGA